MRAFPILAGTALVASTLLAPTAAASDHLLPRSLTAVEYANAVTHVCAGAVLFEHTHRMGTRVDALAVARDIRASTARRLARLKAVPFPPTLQQTSRRWIASQRRLAAVFARTWVEIYDTIASVRTPRQRATLARHLEQLVHAPDPLKRIARHFELALHVPDCTGGG